MQQQEINTLNQEKQRLNQRYQEYVDRYKQSYIQLKLANDRIQQLEAVIAEMKNKNTELPGATQLPDSHTEPQTHVRARHRSSRRQQLLEPAITKGCLCLS